MENHVKVIDRQESEGGVVFEILEYQSLNGVVNPDVARDLYFAQKSGMKLRQIKVSLLREDSEVVTEVGSLQYSKGNLVQENKVGGLGGLAKKLFKNVANREEVFRPSYIGKGEIHMEPVFEHFSIVHMVDGDLLIDEGMFYCASRSLDVSVKMVSSASSKFLGSNGWFHTRVRGTGLLVVKIPVPESELSVVDLNNETLMVDGTFALMFDNSLNYTVGRTSGNLIKSSLGGEGWLETYKGTGTVFLAPTVDVYNDIRKGNSREG